VRAPLRLRLATRETDGYHSAGQYRAAR